MALPYAGVTPHYWTARPMPGVDVLSSRRVASASGAAGAGGHQEIALRIADGVADIVFDLAVAGQPPVMSRQLHLE